MTNKIKTIILIFGFILLFSNCANFQGEKKTSFNRLDNNNYIPLTSTGPYEIINIPAENRRNVMKVDGSAVEWAIAMYSLERYKDKPVKITFSVDVKREGDMGNLNWQVNNNPGYPSIGSINNAIPDVWHTISGTISLIPTADKPYLYLTNWFNNTESTIYYLCNFKIKIEDTVVVPPPNPIADLNLTPLKSAYADAFLIGTIINPAYMAGEYLKLLTHHYNTVTAENALKPIELAPLEKGGQYRWETADKMVNTMLENGIEVQGHVLVWHEQTPAWMTSGTREEVIANLENHITQILNHFRGRILSWDVVNEAIRDDLQNVNASTNWRNCMRTSGNPWFTALGSDYIEISFRKMREIDPNAKLYYNDYGLNNRNKAQAVVNMVNDINRRYKIETGSSRNLIDGIGMQGHYNLNININHVRVSIQLLTSTGLEISITELDISTVGYVPGSFRDSVMNERQARIQADIYASLFKLFLEFKEHIYRVTMWGSDDYNSWLSAGNPCLFDRNLKPKPAFYAVLNAIGN